VPPELDPQIDYEQQWDELKLTNIFKSKISIIIGSLAVLFIMVLLGIQIANNFFGPGTTLDDVPINVKIDQVRLASIYATAPVSGRVQPIEEVIIMPLAPGEVTRVYVQMGDSVARGALLFEIDKAQVAATLNQARVALDGARSNYQRMSTLYSGGAVSQQSYEQARNQYATAQSSYNAASSAYSNTTVRSPIDGFVTALSVSVGSLASPSAPAAVVADTSALKIETSVSEYLAPRLTLGDAVDIHITTLGDKTFRGIITAVSPAPAAGGLTYPISISVQDDSGEVMAGMFAEISIISDERDEVVCVPSDAVIVKAGRFIAVVMEDENMPVFKEVTTGIDNGEFVEITSGLEVGETIVTSGQHFVKEGIAVNIIE
jgi:RND family efflux transporter MFP subunit